MSQQRQPQQPGPADQEYVQEPPPEEERRNKSGTPLSTWVMVFGSSTVFHVLLLILLGMIIIGAPTEEQKEVTVQMPEEEEEKKEEIKMQKTEREVKQDSKVKNPKVQQKSMEKMESRRPQKAGESLEFTSETSNKKAEKAIALGGGGGGGAYGARGGGSGSQVGGGSGSPATEHAVDAALKWLARHQNDKGYWEVSKYDKQCPEGNKCKLFAEGKNRNNVGVTGLSLLAFLGAGYTHQSDEKLGGIHIGNVVHKSLRWLKDRQKKNGALSWGHMRQIYNHAIATMAYAEAYGMTGSPRLKEIAQSAVDYLEKIQNEAGGKKLAWRYHPNDGENDTSVTGWAAMALKSAELAGLEVSKESMKGALRWVEQNTNKRGLTGYESKVTSRGEAWKRRAMTPVGMMVRMFASYELKKKDLKILKQGAEFLVNNTPEWHEGAKFGGGHNKNRMDYYYWYYGSLAVFMFAGPDTQFEQLGYWSEWNQPMQKAVLTGQQKAPEGHEVGSWDPFSRWAGNGGRVYATALNALTLEVYYRYDNALFQ